MGRQSGQESDRGTGFVRSVLYRRSSESTGKVTKRSEWGTLLDNVMHEKLGWKNLLRNTRFLVQNVKILCCKQELFLLVIPNWEIYNTVINIHSHLDDLIFLQIREICHNVPQVYSYWNSSYFLLMIVVHDQLQGNGTHAKCSSFALSFDIACICKSIQAFVKCYPVLCQEM